MPDFSRTAPARCVFSVQDRHGRTWHGWQPGKEEPRPLPSLRGIGSNVRISPSGEHIWWFDDLFGDQAGRWRRTPFEGGESVDAMPRAPSGGARGLALGTTGTAVAALAVPGAGHEVHLLSPDGDCRNIHSGEAPLQVAGLSADESLVLLLHARHGNARCPAMQVLDTEGRTVRELWDGVGRGLETYPSLASFSPVPGDDRVVARHERRGRTELLLWSVRTGEVTELPLPLPGDVTGGFTTDGSALLIVHTHRGRTGLYRYHLDSARLEEIETRYGVVEGVTSLPDGRAWYVWSSSVSPPAVLDEGRRPVLRPVTGTALEAAAHAVPQPSETRTPTGLRIPGWITMPLGVPRPAPAVFLLHGGPRAHDGEEFSAEALAWQDAGFAVVRVNYRGSTGYGCAWRDAALDDVGLAELRDVDAVRADLVSRGLVDPDRCLLAGGSWGGYLALLGAGLEPRNWACVLASSPIADYAAAYEQEPPILQAFDRAMFGGSPSEVPERYRRASPASYADRVEAPLLLIVGNADTRCPPQQTRGYLDRLRARGADVEFHLVQGGHGAASGHDELHRLRLQLDFARRKAGTRKVSP
ncbi:prolyl oligopeptidase family serine peptidase [Streptomyces sp. NPDC003522]